MSLFSLLFSSKNVTLLSSNKITSLNPEFLYGTKDYKIQTWQKYMTAHFEKAEASHDICNDSGEKNVYNHVNIEIKIIRYLILS